MSNIFTIKDKDNIKFSVFTLGCKTNQSESDNISRILTEKGFALVGLKDIPDFAIINTCTVTSATDRKVRQLIRRIKNKSPDTKFVVTGCYTVFNNRFLSDNNMEFIVSNDEKYKIPDLIFKIVKTGLAPFNISGNISDKLFSNNSFISDEIIVKKSYSNKHLDHFFHSRALVKIQDGCEQQCSYCIVPLVRGSYISIPVKKVINEISSLVGMGHEEIVITGIHIGKYGIDFNRSDNLSNLLDEILAKTTVKRIRLSSIEINEIDKNLIKLINLSDGRVARHLHIPLQSGSNRILKEMNRHYTREYFLDVIKDIKDSIPEITFTTDIIVGFPGETEKYFLETIDTIKKVGFSKIHVFKYSKRNGTKAALFENQVSETEKTVRSKKLRNLGFEMRTKFLLYNLGKILDIVCEKIENKREEIVTVSGTSENYIKIYFNLNLQDFKALRVKIIKVITESLYSEGLFGSIV
jgi:threonylcarbamoyladenosine tRNA methylthiotransferase MtaB